MASVDIIHDGPEPGLEFWEEKAAGETEAVAKGVEKILKARGHLVKRYPVKSKTVKELMAKLQGEVVFNLVEECDLGEKVLMELEKRHKVWTGVGAEAFRLSWDKDRVKEKLKAAGLPVPRGQTIGDVRELQETRMVFPAMVKSAENHGSLGISPDSVVSNFEQLRRQVNWLKQQGEKKILVEDFIDGRELAVTVLGDGTEAVVLPVTEIIFGPWFANRAKFLTARSKWDKNSAQFSDSEDHRCPAELLPGEKRKIEAVVRKAMEVLGGRDLVRFDIRLAGETPYVVDYNPNPCLEPESAIKYPIRALGISYPDLVEKLVDLALKRR
jgi:D-alanine-D-alanine ligase